MSLLEEAQQVPTRRRGVVTPEEIEVAVAWAKGELMYRQVAVVFHPHPKKLGTNSGVYMRLAFALREYVKRQP